MLIHITNTSHWKLAVCNAILLAKCRINIMWLSQKQGVVLNYPYMHLGVRYWDSGWRQVRNWSYFKTNIIMKVTHAPLRMLRIFCLRPFWFFWFPPATSFWDDCIQLDWLFVTTRAYTGIRAVGARCQFQDQIWNPHEKLQTQSLLIFLYSLNTSSIFEFSVFGCLYLFLGLNITLWICFYLYLILARAYGA